MSSLQSLTEPLSNKELYELDDFLAADDRAMDLATLEGYLTAIVIGPNVVLPSQWLPRVWDMENGEGQSHFKTTAEANHIMNLLMRFMNEIARVFMENPTSFEPIYYRDACWGAAQWCDGFLLGTYLFDEKLWALLWVAKPTLVSPFLRLGDEEGLALTIKENNAEHWVAAVAPALVAIYEFWKERRSSTAPSDMAQGETPFAPRRTPVTRSTAKIGRNDSCPCGSGKKFKKCCEAKGSTLH